MTAPISNGPTTHGYTTMRDATDIRDSVTNAVGDWTGESRTACDAAIKRLEERGEELAELLVSASRAMKEIRSAGNHAEAKAFACIDS